MPVSLPVLLCITAIAQPTTPAKPNTVYDTVTINNLNRAAVAAVPFNPDTALQQAQQAKAWSEQLRYDKGKADALVTLMSVYQNKGSYTQAVQNGLAALSLYEQLNDIAAQGNTYLLLAMMYKDMSGNERTDTYNNTAVRYSNQAFKLYSSINDTSGIVNSLSMLGTLYRDKAGQHQENKNTLYDTALQAFTTAINLVEKTGKGSEYMGKLYNNISQVYTEQKKDYHTALNYLFKAVAINEKKNNIVSLSHNYGNISENYMKLTDYRQALIYARKMEQTALQTGRPSRINNALLQLYKVFNKSGRPDSALWYYIKATDLNDSLNNLAKTRQVTELETRYEREKKRVENPVPEYRE